MAAGATITRAGKLTELGYIAYRQCLDSRDYFVFSEAQARAGIKLGAMLTGLCAGIHSRVRPDSKLDIEIQSQHGYSTSADGRVKTIQKVECSKQPHYSLEGDLCGEWHCFSWVFCWFGK